MYLMLINRLSFPSLVTIILQRCFRRYQKFLTFVDKMGKVIETVADSIAIEIFDKNTIIIGKGNELHLYSKSTTEKNVFDIDVLPIKLVNKIHGIKKAQNSDDKILLVYGGKEFILLQYNQTFKFDKIYEAELSDWISCGLILNELNEFVLLTAHSVALRFSYNVSLRHCDLKERISCIDKSTLYCAYLSGNTWNELVVFAGNAFGELLIWQPSKNEETYEGPLRPYVSPLLRRISAHNGVVFSIDYNHCSGYIVTTSDDRAIKWWKVEFLTKGDWSGSSIQPMSSGFGHVARVFQGRIITDGPNVYALSVGEDSYFCLWDKSGQLLFKRRQQYGATIWNFVYVNSTKTIYTVGSTGNLVAFGLKDILRDNQNPKNVILLPAIIEGNSMKYIAKVKFLNDRLLIGLTNQNDLITSELKGEEWLSWEILDIKVAFKCTVMEVFENLIAIGGYKSLILLEYQENCGEFRILHEEELLKGVIRNFVFFTKQQYFICDDQGNCILFLNSIDNRRYIELPKCKEPWFTKALLLNDEEYMAISNRQGNLLLYRFLKETNNFELKCIVKHPHGNIGATYLNCVEETSISALIRSTGHDGAVNEFIVDFINNTIQICSRQIVPVAWTEYIEKCSNDIELFLGFNDNHFVVWCREYDFLLQIPCGGGHRSWSFIRNRKTEAISLVFIKNKRARFYKMPLFNKELTALPLAKRWHIAPCNVVEILPQKCPSSHIVVSAGDDNLIKIHTYSKQTGLKQHKEIQNHISNIRCLKVLSLNGNEFLVFSGGGRAQLCVTKINSINFNVNELINYSLKQENSNNFNSNSYNYGAETRLMSLDVKALKNGEYKIYVGCSDGFIKLLKLNLITLDMILLAQYFYSKCILQIRYINEADLILVAATDGAIKIFDNALSQCLYKLDHHSSGVNGLSFLYNIPKECLHVLSGGDDQVVSYTELSLKNLDFQILRQFRKPYLHTSQVCACALSSNGLYGYTSGVDQVLNKLDLKTGEIIDSFCSCVADIKGEALIDDNVCLLYGCGFQIYEFNT